MCTAFDSQNESAHFLQNWVFSHWYRGVLVPHWTALALENGLFTYLVE